MGMQRFDFGGKRRRRFGVERMEERLLLAGDVQVFLDDGNLIIRGDDQDNVIDVSGSASDGTFTVVGLAGTTFNGGQPGPIVVNGVTDDVRIDLKGGDDTLTSEKLFIRDDLRVDMGSGDNLVMLETTAVVDYFGFTSGSGSDTIELDNLEADGDFVIKSHGGDNDIRVIGDMNEFEQDVRVKLHGTGDNLVIINGGVIFDDLSIKTRSGSDSIQISDVEVGDTLGIKTDGGGNDTINVDTVEVGGDLNIKAKHGNDVIRVVDSFIGEDLSIDGYKGHDLAYVEGVTVAEEFEFNGHDGDDTACIVDSIMEEANIDLDDGDDEAHLTGVQVTDEARLDGDDDFDFLGLGVNDFADVDIEEFEDEGPFDCDDPIPPVTIA